METTATQALWFLPAAVPIGLWVAWSDMARMIIPNKAVVALTLAFAVLGVLALPLDVYLWRYLHLAVVLAVGVALYAVRLVGAGDAKFAAAAAPMIALGDLFSLLGIYVVCLFGGYALHRLLRASALRRATPDWASWSSGKKFPMGLPLAATLIVYLVLAVTLPPLAA